jgi:hypothetical protein
MAYQPETKTFLDLLAWVLRSAANVYASLLLTAWGPLDLEAMLGVLSMQNALPVPRTLQNAATSVERRKSSTGSSGAKEEQLWLTPRTPDLTGICIGPDPNANKGQQVQRQERYGMGKAGGSNHSHRP